MECRNLEVFVRSATDLKEMKVIGKMDPYVSVYLSGDPSSKQKTEVDTDGGKNPKWKGEPMKFVINEDLAKSSNVTLVFKIMAEKPSGDKEIGEVNVPVKDLLEDGSAKKAEKSLSYNVKTPSGKTKGTLNFAYKLGEKFTVENTAQKNLHEPVTAYPPTMAAGSSSVAPGTGYPPPPPYGSGQYPQQAGYGYPPAQGYQLAGYGAPSQPGYGYPGGPPPQPGYKYPSAPPPGPYGYPGYPPAPGYGGYPGAPPMQMVQPQEKKSGMGMGGVGLGIGVGLLGGLLIREFLSLYFLLFFFFVWVEWRIQQCFKKR